jgi:hypothetical protein
MNLWDEDSGPEEGSSADAARQEALGGRHRPWYPA